ncbi:helix-turn-helix transcriptional regulator [Pseudochelatococcus sp. G4_1912]|uniref:helix-turn-helix transcriptional regulator n=1 Tax=Pseudochelatococcus sp. G4_1912 TaxID=3114288 RepID=UPI0039C5E977
MATKSAVATRFQLRRGLGEPEAALYLGLGSSKFRQLVNEGRMPRPRLIDSRRIWDVDDLDAAFRGLPIEGDSGHEDDDPWSRVSV